MTLDDFWFQQQGGGPNPDQIGNSLRFRGGGQRLTRTPSTVGNRRVFTTSYWVKRGKLTTSGYTCMFNAGNSTNNNTTDNYYIRFRSDDVLNAGVYSTAMINTPGKYRDPGAWMHVVVAVDQNNTSESCRAYVNGELVQATNSVNSSNLACNNTVLHAIGYFNVNPSEAFNGYLAEFHHVDGAQLDPTTFGEFNADGVWIPRQVTGLTYGTNGFYLDFSDPNNIGADRSGNGNDFTATGFELTDTTSRLYDWMADSPTDNHSTYNPLTGDSRISYSNANLTGGNSGAGWSLVSPTIELPEGGTYYFEVTSANFSAGQYIGVFDALSSDNNTVARIAISQDGGVLRTGPGLPNDTCAGYSNGDIVGVLVNRDTGFIEFFANGTSIYSMTDNWVVTAQLKLSNINFPGNSSDVNYGQRPFQHQPAGTLPLSTAELPNAAITNPSEHFQTILGPGPSSGATAWSTTNTAVSVSGGQLTEHDGLANSQFIWGRTDTTYPPFDYIRGLNDSSYQGFNDWYVPSKFELDVAYRNFKPKAENNASVNVGANNYAVPQVPVYTTSVPGQTTLTDWQAGGSQAFSNNNPGFVYYTSSAPSTNASQGIVFERINNDAGYLIQNWQKYNVNGKTRAFRREPFTGSEPAIGDAYAGGYFAGLYSLNGDGTATHALIVADKATGENGGILTAAQATFPNGLWWIKDRANSNQHQLVDSVRGGNQMVQTPGTGRGNYVAPAGNSVAWCWATPGNEVTNNDGSQPSQCDANVEAGFSVITYQGGTLGATYGHGLQGEPDFIMARRFDANGGWMCYHSSLGKDSWIDLGSSNSATNSNNVWGVNAPTDAVFGVSNTTTNRNSEGSVVAYCWRSVPGFSAFGTYQGNNNVDGPFCFTGFRPGWILIKQSAGGNGGWAIYDTHRSTFNPAIASLRSNETTEEQQLSAVSWDILSNGFKVRNNNANYNSSGSSFIWASFAEHPFGGGNVSPSPAR